MSYGLLDGMLDGWCMDWGSNGDHSWWHVDVPQVAVDGRKVGSGIWVPEIVVYGLGGTKVGADMGIGDPVGRA